MPIELSTYPDRSPVLSEEERQEIAYLLTLSPRFFHAFEQHAARVARVTQPLIDLFRLFRQWRPTSYVPKQYFVSYLLGHVLQSNTLYWGWSSSMWELVIDAIPLLQSNAVALRKEPGYTTTPGPHSLLAHLAAYLFLTILSRPEKRVSRSSDGRDPFWPGDGASSDYQSHETMVSDGYAEKRR